MATMTDGDEGDVVQYQRWFEDAESATMDERQKAERDRDYYDNKQFTAAEEAALKKKGQPIIVVNRIKRKIDFLRGIEAQQRTDPKAFPRTPHEADAAQAATDALRYVADASDLDVIASDVWENLLIEGFGGAEVRVEPKRSPRADLVGSTAMTPPTQDYNIVIEHCPWDRLFRDPHSRKPDCSDARYLGSVLWMDIDEAAERWPDSADDLRSLAETSVSQSNTYDDRPGYSIWVDGKRRRVRVVQMWHRKGRGWNFCTFTSGVKLEGGVSPYLDEDGAPICPLIVQSAYVDRENRRYGVVREMVGPQDEINKRRSKALHLLSTRQTLSELGAVKDINETKRELAKPDGHVEVTPGMRFEVLQTGDMASGQFQLLQEAKTEIDLMGPNASMQGKASGEQSGRAIIAQQQGGYIELGPMSDRMKHWKIAIYRAIWQRVRQFWTAERWIRVTDDQRNMRFVGLNRPMTLGEQLTKDAEQQGMPPDVIQEELVQLQAQGHDLQRPVGTANSVATIDVDIIIDAAPDTVTIQHEQFVEITNLVRAGVQFPPEVLIEASQLRNKDKLLEMLKSGPPPEAQQAQQQAMALDMAQKQAQVEKTQAEAERARADAAAKARLDGQPPQAALVTPEPTDQVGQAKTVAEIHRTQAQTFKLGVDAAKVLQDMALAGAAPVIPQESATGLM